MSAGPDRSDCLRDREIASWRGVPFTPPVACSYDKSTCQILMNVYAPTDTGPWPLVVVVPGGGEPPDQTVDYTDDFALAIADRGAVVMTANWRQDSEHGGGLDKSRADVACAVGVARATAPAYGADPALLVLAGHSLSAQLVALMGLTPSPTLPDAGSCNATSGSTRPDAIVVMAGLFFPDSLQLAASDSVAEHIPVVIAQGGADDPTRVASSRAFQEALTANGWDSMLVEVPAATHPGILIEPATIDATMALATGR